MKFRIVFFLIKISVISLIHKSYSYSIICCIRTFVSYNFRFEDVGWDR